MHFTAWKWKYRRTYLGSKRDAAMHPRSAEIRDRKFLYSVLFFLCRSPFLVGKYDGDWILEDTPFSDVPVDDGFGPCSLPIHFDLGFLCLMDDVYGLHDGYTQGCNHFLSSSFFTNQFYLPTRSRASAPLLGKRPKERESTGT